MKKKNDKKSLIEMILNSNPYLLIANGRLLSKRLLIIVNCPGDESLIPDRSHTFMEIDHEIISAVILLPSADS